MITLDQPSIALNDYRFGSVYHMWRSLPVRATHSPGDIIAMVVAAARSAPNGRVKHVVFNCHGSPGKIIVGAGQFDRGNVQLFHRWAGLVGKIWLIACGSARIQGAGSATDGNVFCGEIAFQAHCWVVASTEVQSDTGRTYPYGQITTFEGLLLSYGPRGYANWHHKYPSNWAANHE